MEAQKLSSLPGLNDASISSCFIVPWEMVQLLRARWGRAHRGHLTVGIGPAKGSWSSRDPRLWVWTWRGKVLGTKSEWGKHLQGFPLFLEVAWGRPLSEPQINLR